jgi:hypothetical protein
MAIHNSFDTLSDLIESAQATAERIQKLLPNWQLLTGLLSLADGLSDIEIIRSQIQHIEEQRLLLAEPDPVAPVLTNLSQKFRSLLKALKQEYDQVYAAGIRSLALDANWQAIEPEQQDEILRSNQIDESAIPAIDLADTRAILKTLRQTPLGSFRDRIAALPSRFGKALEEAVKNSEPESHVVSLPRQLLKTPNDIDAYIRGLKKILEDELTKGPIVIN